MKTIWKQLKRYVVGVPSAPESLTLTDPDVIEGFRDLAQDLRSNRPVCPVSGGGILLLKSEDVKAAFSNRDLCNAPSRFSALAPKNKDVYVAASVAANILPFLDGPRHMTLRKWASGAFFRQFRNFADEIDDIAARHSETLKAGQTYLLVEDVARRFVVEVIGRFIGVSFEPDEMKRYTSALFRLFAPAADADVFAQTNDGLAQARKGLAQALADRRHDKSNCLLNTLDETFPSDLDEAERDQLIIDNALLFLADGVENVEAAIGVVMMRYVAHDDPISPDFVRQAIRDDTPGQTIARIASQDMSIGDAMLKAGTPVFLSLSSANDGSEEGDEFSFGRGRHKCIGETLAISMVTAMCTLLAQREPKVDASALRYRAMFGHKWPRGVTITLGK